jgi:hypothetical protein
MIWQTISIWFVLGGTLWLSIGAFLGQRSLHLLRQGRTASGTVVEPPAEPQDGLVAPRVRFLLPDGQAVEFDSHFYQNRKSGRLQPGSRCEVLYLEQNPAGSARLKRLQDLYLGPLLCTVMGLILLAVGGAGVSGLAG